DASHFVWDQYRVEQRRYTSLKGNSGVIADQPWSGGEPIYIVKLDIPIPNPDDIKDVNKIYDIYVAQRLLKPLSTEMHRFPIKQLSPDDKERMIKEIEEVKKTDPEKAKQLYNRYESITS